MSDLLTLTLPLFLLIALGYAAVRGGLFAAGDVRTLGSFVLYVALPALIVRAFSQRPLGDIFDANYVAAVALGGLVVFAIGWLAARALALPREGAALAAMGMVAANTGYIGYPLAALVLGPGAAVALALNLLVENLLIIPLALALAESAASQGQRWPQVLRGTAQRLLRSPLIIAIAAGTLLSLSGLQLPAAAGKAIDLLATASAPVALFAIGGMLHGSSVRGLAAPLALIVTGKLVLHPLAVALALQVFPVADPVLATAAVLLAAVPMIAIYPVLGQRFGQQRLTAAALLVSVLVSVLTVNGVLWLLGR
ncbi:AEC family transporter [Pseudorhodoferax sp.]|uniref:AEC family transporter n=1 Tax=Pseudorhodoferax sp. TaxID=1993553 RepID=UPI002DD65325|nr:AEC family transporter [Pseudorhodoferax sp.]